jgi:hypothetical protein
MPIFFENKSAKVYYDLDLDSFFLEYTDKVVNHEQFVIINTALLNAFKKMHTKKFVADIRKMGVISIESQKWIVDILIPEMMKHVGGENMIVAQLIDSSEIFAKVAANKINEQVKDDKAGFQVIQFTDRSEMEAYLKSV